MTTLLKPNQVLSKKSVKTIIIGEVIFTLFVWLTIPSTFFPKPTELLSAISNMWFNWDLGQNLITSFSLNLETIALSLIITLSLAYLSTIPIFKPVVDFISKLRFLSMAGLSFFFTLMAHNGHQLKLSLLVFSVSVFFIVGMLDVIKQIPKEMYDLARTLHMGDWHILWEVVILGQIDKVFDVLRQNAAMGWMILTEVETMSRSDGGVGALLMTQQRYLNLGAIFGIQLLILIVGVLQDYAIGYLKQLCCPYSSLKLENK